MALKRARSTSASSELFFSDYQEHADSKFIGVFSQTLSAKALQELEQFKTATHRIAAWRIPSRQKSINPKAEVLYDVRHDDDGERGGGNTLKRVLVEKELQGAIVVARWFGGQMIGPMRFTLMESCAKNAIWSWESAQREEAQKKRKLDEEATKAQLVETLGERDQSISVLRQLLATKTAALKGTEPEPPTPQKKPPDYTKMPLAALQKLDKARDASISFILKEIDRTEEQISALADLEDITDDSWKDVEAEDKGGAAAEDKGKQRAASPKTPDGKDWALDYAV